MKIVQINDNLKINIESIYSLERHTNQNLINDWKTSYNEFIVSNYANPIALTCGDKIIKPDFDNITDEDLSEYSKSLKEYIIQIIGECPEYNESYILILSNGLKINIDKFIYDKLDKELDKYKV